MIGEGIDVCIVEDNDDLREEMACALSQQGFAVRAFADARGLYAGLLQEPTSLLVLDLSLPDEDGRAVMARIIDMMPVGIVICSARTAVEERIDSMIAGADAYLVKPVNVDELAATLVSVHRRMTSQSGSAPRKPRWRLEDDGWTLCSPKGKKVPLTGSESTVLVLLFANTGKPVPRERLIEALGHDSDYFLDHRLDMLFSRLRRKVRESASERLPLRAIRGVGFIVSP